MTDPFQHNRTLSLALILLLPFTISTQTLSVSAQEISMLADTLPEFKSDPWSTESEGDALSSVVRCMIQDSKGNYWWGTQNGLCRYDGHQLIYFDLRDADGQAIVPKDILEHEDGTLWFTHDGGLSRYDGQTFDTYTSADGLPDDNAWGLCLDTSGELWVGTLLGACRSDGSTFTTVDLPRSSLAPAPSGVHSPSMVRAIMEDCQQRIWLAQEGGVYVSKGKDFERMILPEDEDPIYVTDIVEDRSGDLWLTTMTQGIIHFDGRRFTMTSLTMGWPKGECYSIFEDHAGNLWFPIEHQGVYRYDGSQTRLFSMDDGLESHNIHSIYEDLQGRVWFFGWGGVSRFDPARSSLEEKEVVNVNRNGPW